MENPSPPLRTVLLVDDNDMNRVTTRWFLSNFGYTVECARSGEEALALFDPRVHDIVITGDFMPGMTGVELAHIIKLRSSPTPVLMRTTGPAENQSCLDMILPRATHPLALKEAVEKLLPAKEQNLSL